MSRKTKFYLNNYEKRISILMSSLVFVVSLFSIQPTFAKKTTPEFTKEFCAVSQAEKCKQTGTGCPGKKVCFWKDLGQIAETTGKIAGTVATALVIADALD